MMTRLERRPADRPRQQRGEQFHQPDEDLSPRGYDAIANIVFHGVLRWRRMRWIADGLGARSINILTTWVWNSSPYTVPSAMSTGISVMGQSPRGRVGALRHPASARSAPARSRPRACRRSSIRAEATYNDMSANPLGRVRADGELTNLATFPDGRRLRLSHRPDHRHRRRFTISRRPAAISRPCRSHRRRLGEYRGMIRASTHEGPRETRGVI